MKYLSAASIIAINVRIQQRFGTTPSIRDAEALDYIVKSASQEVFGRVLYPEIEQLATFYLIKVTKKHVFNEANKRTALQSAVMFLDRSGYELKVDHQIRVAKQVVRIAQINGEPDSLRRETEMLVRESIIKL